MFPAIHEVPDSYCDLDKFFRFTHQVSFALYEIVKDRHKDYRLPGGFEELSGQRGQIASNRSIAAALTLLDAAADLRDLHLKYESLHSDPEQEILATRFREFEANPGKYHIDPGEAHVLREFDTRCLRQFVAPVPVFVALRKSVPTYVSGASPTVLQPWIDEYHEQTLSLPDTGHGWYHEIYGWLADLRETLPQLARVTPRLAARLCASRCTCLAKCFCSTRCWSGISPGI
ncbi:MAG: hypothetical protein JNL98_08825 [Bryobacterales bacterium]|nr:hypothetical protein [Bryobacterales bacterium]